MRDALERIRNRGNSSLLLNLTNQTTPSRDPASSSFDNVMIHTEVNCVADPAEFVIEDENDFFEKREGVKVVQMKSGVCNDPDIDMWNLNVFCLLRELVVGTNCVLFVRQLKLVGFKKLERVEIGSDCFKAKKDCVFELRDCQSLKWVSIGDGSFVHCEITVFESECCGMESETDLPKLTALHLGREVFRGDEDNENVLVLKRGRLGKV